MIKSVTKDKGLTARVSGFTRKQVHGTFSVPVGRGGTIACLYDGNILAVRSRWNSSLREVEGRLRKVIFRSHQRKAGTTSPGLSSRDQSEFSCW